MTKTRCVWISLLLAIAASSASRCLAQVPTSREHRVNVETKYAQDSARLAVLGDGSFAVLWQSGRRNCPGPTTPDTPCTGDLEPFSVARFYDSHGAAVTGEIDMAERPATPLFSLPGTVDGFRFAWADGDYASQGFDGAEFVPPSTHPVGSFTFGPLASTDSISVDGAARTPNGGFVATWITNHDDSAFSGRDVRLARFDAAAAMVGNALTLDADADLRRGSADVGTDALGGAVAAWIGDCSEDQFDCDIFAQRLSPTNELLGGPLRVNSNRSRAQFRPSVAVARDGSFLLAWESQEPSHDTNPFATDVAGQVFSPAGTKLGSEIPIGILPDASDMLPATAVDPSGNYLVAWSTFRRENGIYGFDVVGQLVRHDGSKVGGAFRISEKQTGNEFPQPKVGFAENGTFVAAWNADDGDFDGVFARRFFASPADEPCVFRGGRYRCDGARTGGDGELQGFFSIRSGSEPLLGDMDGDGRDDLCARRVDHLRCDLDHLGEPPEFNETFGETGEKLLLGDVDRDGRDDACLRRGNRFFCDTGHDGGDPETNFAFGRSTDVALLGDVDGDGRAEPCVWRDGGFRCDTGHNGGAAEWSVPFGETGDMPLLGDLDGDGKKDPCVYRAGAFLCMTDPHGAAAVVEVHFGQGDEVPLIGNVDGL